MTTESDIGKYKQAEIEGNALGDEIVFFDDRVGKYYATGAVGGDIWRLLATPMNLDTVVTRLLELYDTDEATCRSTTKDFIDHMIRVNLIEKC